MSSKKMSDMVVIKNKEAFKKGDQHPDKCSFQYTLQAAATLDTKVQIFDSQ
jgi:hypothetical protein